MDRSIALVGLPGVGKTRVGSLLADRLSCPFLDSDAEIERVAQAKVADIFRTQGEDVFRRRERAAVLRTIESGRCVLALGGGGFEDGETRAFLLSESTVIWLDAPDAVLLPRLARAGHRPLFKDDEPEEVLARLRRLRTPAYAQAHHRIVADTADEFVAGIMAMLAR